MRKKTFSPSSVCPMIWCSRWAQIPPPPHPPSFGKVPVANSIAWHIHASCHAHVYPGRLCAFPFLLYRRHHKCSGPVLFSFLIDSFTCMPLRGSDFSLSLSCFFRRGAQDTLVKNIAPFCYLSTQIMQAYGAVPSYFGWCVSGRYLDLL